MLIEIGVVVFVYFMIFFILGTLLKNNSVVDQAWGIGFVLIAFYSMIRQQSYSMISVITVLLVTLWGGRLFYHIMKRNFGKPEDFRYANWREQWGRFVVVRAFFQVYLLQGALMFLIAYPIVLIHEMQNQSLNMLTIIGILIWGLGYFFEVVGDAQLHNFKSSPENKGKLMTSGLWQYTRHPNYFGEATMWWGVFVIAISADVSWVAIFSPILITFLLLYVSGVPMLEKAMEGREGFKEYAKRTNKFIPWFRKG